MKKRSKYIALSVSALALVSVCSIGFATWLVGIQQTTDEVTLEAQVDDYVNDTVFLSANLSTPSVKICETKEVEKTGNNIIGTTEPGEEGGIGYDKDGLSFTFSDITLKVSKKATVVPTSVTISLSAEDGDNAWNSVPAGKNELGDKRTSVKGIAPAPWTYLDFDDVTLDFDTDFVDVSSGQGDNAIYNTYSITEKKLSFKWGTFFNNKAPTEFYNGVYSGVNDFGEVFKGVTAITTELEAMKGAFTGQTITLKVEAETSAVGA